MKPLDPRLARYAKAARRWIILTACLGLAQAAAIIGQSFAISGAISPVITRHAGLSAVAPALVALAAIGLVRCLLTYTRARLAHRSARNAIAELRQQVVDHARSLGPRWIGVKGADTATLATRGLDDIEPYFVDYLPQLMLAATVTPLSLTVILFLDWISALVAVITIPLIPVFMILIGRLTQAFADRRLATMQRQGRQLLDLIAGLPTLSALGRTKGPEREITRVGRHFVDATMSTLRVAFLSGAVLEFISVLSVALVAVEVGMRLVYGHIDLFTGLVIIMLAPDVYAPIREVGKHFHASSNGVAAANAAFEILETPRPPSGNAPVPGTRLPLVLDEVSVPARGTWAPYRLSGRIEPGRLTVLAGPSGAGKTTILNVIMRRLQPSHGRVLLGETNIETLDERQWWSQLSWLPQRPVILPGTLRQAIGVDASEAKLEHAAKTAGFLEVVRQAPDGWETTIGSGGIGLSVGQRQRLALTRLLLEESPYVFLDEPTAHLDHDLERHVLDTIEALKRQGRTIVAIAHRPSLIAAADAVLTVESRPMDANERQQWANSNDVPAATPAPSEPGLLDLLDDEVTYP